MKSNVIIKHRNFFSFYLQLDAQQKSQKNKLDKYISMEERHRNDMKR